MALEPTDCKGKMRFVSHEWLIWKWNVWGGKIYKRPFELYKHLLKFTQHHFHQLFFCSFPDFPGGPPGIPGGPPGVPPGPLGSVPGRFR